MSMAIRLVVEKSCFRRAWPLVLLVVGQLFLSTRTICAAMPDGAGAASNRELMDRLKRATCIKGLLHQLDALPDHDLKDLLVQLRGLRRLRTTPAPRDPSEVSIGKLTDEELVQISNLVPAPESRTRKPYKPLDIPHDLKHMPASKFAGAFHILPPNGDPKALEGVLHTTNTGVFGEAERQSRTAILSEDSNSLDEVTSKVESTTGMITDDADQDTAYETPQLDSNDLDLDAHH